MESDLARTAIYGVKSVLSNMDDKVTSDILTGLIHGKPPKVSVFKEVVRLLAEYLHLPKVLDAYTKLWYRKHLNKDVRIILLSCTVGKLLAEKSTAEIKSAAWSIIGNCIESDNIAIAGTVFSMISVKCQETWCKYHCMTSFSVQYTGYKYGEMPTWVSNLHCNLLISIRRWQN
jgi:hypothetical protein